MNMDTMLVTAVTNLLRAVETTGALLSIGPNGGIAVGGVEHFTVQGATAAAYERNPDRLTFGKVLAQREAARRSLARLLKAAPLADDYRLAVTVMCHGMPDDMSAACEELRAARAEAVDVLPEFYRRVTSDGDQPTPGDAGDHVPSGGQTAPGADVRAALPGDGLTGEGAT